MKQAEIIAREITSQIIADDLPVGTLLPKEHEMLKVYEVARSTLREALRLLETRGVITMRSGRDGGPVVRGPQPSDLASSLTLLLEFRRVPFSEVFAAREALGPHLARMAAERMDDATLEAMAESVEFCANNLDNRNEFLAEGHRFHELIAAAASNPVLELFAASLESLIDSLALAVMGEVTREQRVEALHEHRNLLEVFQTRDPDAAEEGMRRHLKIGHNSWDRSHSELPSRTVQWTNLPPRR